MTITSIKVDVNVKYIGNKNMHLQPDDEIGITRMSDY